jgi:fibronectin type 3 domain-containing protein
MLRNRNDSTLVMKVDLRPTGASHAWHSHFANMNSHPRSHAFTGVLLAVLLTHGLSSCIQRDSVGITKGNAVALSWDRPTTNVDGSGLVDLAGYRIYYGTALGEYPHMVEVDDPQITRHVVADLLPATYYFVVTAYDAEGNESEHSNVAIKNIQ